MRAGFLGALIRAAGLLIAFAVQMLLARLIGDAASYGLYAWGQNLLFLLGAVFALGIPLASARFVAVHDHRGDTAAASEVVGASLRWLLLTSTVGIAAGFAVVAVLPLSAFSDIPRSVVLLAIVAAPLVSLIVLLQSHARARAQLLLAFAPNQALRPLLTGLLAGAFAFWAGRQLQTMEVLLLLCGSLLLVALLQTIIARRLNARRQHTLLSAAPLAEAGSYAPSQLMHNALPLFGTRLADMVMKYGNIFLLGILGGPVVAAGFFVADRLARLGAIPGTVVAAVIQPWLASAHAEGERHALQAVVTEASHVSLWPTLTACLALYLLGPLLLSLFGHDFKSAVTVLNILLLVHVAAATLGPCQQILVMSGQQHALMRLLALAAVVHVCALFLLIPLYGATGAALATLASTSLARSGCLILVRKRMGLQPSALVHLIKRLRTRELK
jgi:O-antigen/teichoic acid export membrane protein